MCVQKIKKYEIWQYNLNRVSWLSDSNSCWGMAIISESERGLFGKTIH